MQDRDILSNRKGVIEMARERNPIRWPNGIRSFEPIGTVMLNPDKERDQEARSHKI